MDELRREALQVLGYHPDEAGEIGSAVYSLTLPQQARLEATLGRCLIRALNKRVRANG